MIRQHGTHLQHFHIQVSIFARSARPMLNTDIFCIVQTTLSWIARLTVGSMPMFHSISKLAKLSAKNLTSLHVTKRVATAIYHQKSVSKATNDLEMIQTDNDEQFSYGCKQVSCSSMAVCCGHFWAINILDHPNKYTDPPHWGATEGHCPWAHLQ